MSTFISYSRVNSEFVVRLARDLKSSGFDVWLDQLDIPKGARWDDEIELAVEKATIFMIVLAPESIESQNVKDELSYALDSGKLILPVVIQPCKIPLRLRRFQYVDFTDKPYKESLTDIKNLLGKLKQNTRPLRAPVGDVPAIQAEEEAAPIDVAMPQHEQPSHSVSLTSNNLGGKNPRRRAVALGVSIAAIVIAAVGVVAASAARSREVPAPVTSSSTFTLTLEKPTETPTITATPLPRQVTDFRGVTMMLVSAGEFIMGNESGTREEGPVQTLFLSDFYIDKYEVTNAFYRACVDAGQCQPPVKDASRTQPGYFNKPEFKKYPVVYVTWDMANDYCNWRGARLPTEAEWEKAARGPDGKIYPWGNVASCDQANYSGCEKEQDTGPVNSYAGGQSIYEVMDLAGNVSEWVNSLYKDYPYDSAREDSLTSGERVVRGGSFADSDQSVRATARQKEDPSIARDNIGFRCVGMPRGSLNESTLVTVTPTRNPARASVTAGNAREKGQSTATLSPAPQTATLLQLILTYTVETPASETPTLVVTKTDVPTTEVVTTEPAPVTTEPPPITTEPPVVTTEAPPVTTEPAPVTTEPPPITTEPPPETTEPAPENPAVMQ